MNRTMLALSVRNALMTVMGAACVIGYTSAHAESASTTSSQTKAVTAPAPEANKEVPLTSPANKQSSSTKGAVTNLNTVKVTGQLAALLRSAETKRDAIGIVDSVSAEEAGKFPDQNVADALQRVPGVSVNRSGGESNQVTVRGFGPSFVNVLLNGRTMATSASDRAFNFDVLPTEVISQAVVHKTGAADLPAGGIGGTINIITADPLDFKGFHAAASAAAVNDNLGGALSSKTTPNISGMFGDTNADNTFGWLASFVYYKRIHTGQNLSDWGWIPNQNFTRINPSYTNISLPQSLQATVLNETRTRKSFSGAIDWAPTENLKIKVDTLLSEYKVDSKQTAFGLYTSPSDVQSLTADANGTALKFTRYNTGSLSNDYILQSSPSDAFNEQTGAHVTYQFNNATELDFDSSVSKAWDKPSGAGYFLVVGTRNVGVNPTWTNNGPGYLPSYTNILSPTDTSVLRAHAVYNGSHNVSDDIFQNKLHLSRSFTDGVLAKLDFGAETSQRTKTEVNWSNPDSFACAEYCGYVASIPADAIGAHVFNAGSLVNGAAPGFPTQWVTYDASKLLAYLATPAAYDQLPNPAAFAARLAANGGSFAAKVDPRSYMKIKEKIESLYGSARFEGMAANMPWTLDAGLRYTKTDTISYANSSPVIAIYVNPLDLSNANPTYGPLQPISASGSYSNWLPSADFKLNLRDNLIFRLAASETLTRPDLGNLSAATSYNFRPQDQTVSHGNAALKPYISKNFDAGIEWYMNGASYIALDGFYKKVSNFSTLITRPVSILGFPFQLTEPVNLNTATIKGAEFTFNYQFTSLPEPFDGLGIATNYTYVTSNASISPGKILTSGKFAVPGIGNSYNASAYYEKGPVQLRLAYNWRAAYLSTIAGDQGQPTTVRSYGQLDLSASYALNKYLSMFLDATNLTNETLSQYQIYQNRSSYAEANGRTVFLGARVNWK